MSSTLRINEPRATARFASYFSGLVRLEQNRGVIWLSKSHIRLRFRQHRGHMSRNFREEFLRQFKITTSRSFSIFRKVRVKLVAKSAVIRPTIPLAQFLHQRTINGTADCRQRSGVASNSERQLVGLISTSVESRGYDPHARRFWENTDCWRGDRVLSRGRRRSSGRRLNSLQRLARLSDYPLVALPERGSKSLSAKRELVRVSPTSVYSSNFLIK
ncbi:MAG: hypothetical protein P4L99_25695 [Chthoniobacter sp.]|nr:hypothetical protein [Chthoniobacter sp.]